MSGVICFGEALIDFLNRGASTEGALEIPNFNQYPGGAPANAAVAVAKLGGVSRFVGQVGQDTFGDFLLSSMEAYGVGTQYVSRHASAHTALAFVTLDKHGERSFEFYREDTADLLLSPDQISDSCFSGCTIFHFCSNTLTTEYMAQTTLKVLERAKAKGLTISFDANLRHNLWLNNQASAELVTQYLHQSDIVKLSREELDFLALHYQVGKRAASEESSHDWLKACIKAGVKLILITDGGGMVEVLTPGEHFKVSTPEVPVVDTTAAGDAFTGGFLYSLSQLPEFNLQAVDSFTLDSLTKGTLQGLVEFAARCGAFTVTKPGAYTALPSRQELHAYFSGN